MLTKIYYQGAEILSAFLNGTKVFESSTTPVIPSGDMGLRANYSGTGWYKATDSGTVFCKGVPALETHVFSDSPKEYVSVYTKAQILSINAALAATSNMTDMSGIFSNLTSFNQNISSWDTSNVTSMALMFVDATAFNQDISSWNTRNVTNMRYMFANAAAFNQDISSWNTRNVTSMDGMFASAIAFNRNLSQWCVTGFTSEPTSFSSNASSWTLPKPVWGTCPRGENLP